MVRTGLRAPTYLDLSAFGCLGTGIPYAVAASLSNPTRRVILVVGDGFFGLNDDGAGDGRSRRGANPRRRRRQPRLEHRTG
ncbi:MAG: thiamine pyrophosphate-dependent enzyme [Solirubrobacterales bacterium]